MNLFALTDNPSARILKFSITGPLQAEISTHFEDARSDFNRNITDKIPFDGKYSPESNELLEIPDFEDIDSIGDAVQNPRAIDDLIPTDDVFDSIKAIFAGESSPSGNPEILIQKFDRKKVISTSGISLYYSNNTYKKVDGKGLTLDPKLTAILHDRSLTFKSFYFLRQIFDMSSYYKEATDQDISVFSQNPAIEIMDNLAFTKKADTWIRRKISLIQQSGILTSVPMHTIKAIADDFRIPITISNGKITFPDSVKEIKAILRLLDEDYYKSPLSNTHCVANSKRIVTSP